MLEYLTSFLRIKKLNHDISKEKLEILSDIFSDSNDFDKINNIVLAEKFHFIFEYEYKPKTIRKLVKFQDPITALKLFKRGSIFLNDEDEYITHKKQIFIILIAYLFCIIGFIGVFFIIFTYLLNQQDIIKILFSCIDINIVNIVKTNALYDIFYFIVSIGFFAVGINTLDENNCAESFIHLQSKENNNKIKEPIELDEKIFKIGKEQYDKV